jgi:AcrR family transcriptional regulator
MPRPRSDIQPRIVEAARARFLQSGVDGASLREIARDAGTNIGMIVYYFPNKDDLFLEVVEETYAKLLVDLQGALSGEGSARAKLHRAFVRIGRASDRELEVIRLVVREALLSTTRFKRIVSRFMRGHVPLIIATVAAGVDNGEFDPSIPMPILLVAVIGLGAFPQLIRRATEELAPFSALPGPERLAEATLDLLFRAVGGLPGGGRRSPTGRGVPPRMRSAKRSSA